MTYVGRKPGTKVGSGTAHMNPVFSLVERDYARSCGSWQRRLRGRQVAVVPNTEAVSRLADRLAPRCAEAGIAIARVKSKGEIIDIRAG